MGDEFKQCLDRDHFDRDCRRDDFCTSSRDRCERSDDWGWGDWLPILIIVFLLCGGTNIFGGSRDDCYDNGGFGGSWLLILLVIFLFLGNQRDGRGFLGGIL